MKIPETHEYTELEIKLIHALQKLTAKRDRLKLSLQFAVRATPAELEAIHAQAARGDDEYIERLEVNERPAWAKTRTPGHRAPNRRLQPK